MIFAIDKDCKTAATDGKRIFFGPEFLDGLSDEELDIVMMHEILHIVLKHIFRGKNLENERFNVACDIVINSNIMLERGVTRPIILKKHGFLMHIAPDGKEGHIYTAEEVYEMLPPDVQKKDGKKFLGGDLSGEEIDYAQSGDGCECGAVNVFYDGHERWITVDEKVSNEYTDFLRDAWKSRITNAALTVEILNANRLFGGGGMMANRLLKELRKSKINWREILNNFIHEEVNDYSFSPPDRRFDETGFFLPDFNAKEEKIKNIWFVVDTSGSISDAAIAAAYSEIVSAIEQFGGHLEGLLSFTEGYVTDPILFSSVADIMAIKPIGGGGNDFSDIFRYMNTNMSDNYPSYIVIITDGYDAFPDEKEANGIPVLWLINNEDAEPPWGKTTRIDVP